MKIALLAIFACLSISTSSAYAADALVVGKTYVAQCNITVPANRHLMTNFRSGEFLPIGTAVRLLSFDELKAVVQRADTKEKISLFNVPQHTQSKMVTAFARLFAATPANIDSFSEETVRAIKENTVIKGMSKKAVLRTLCYPPATLNPSLQHSEWRYLNTPESELRITFDAKGKVQEIATQ